MWAFCLLFAAYLTYGHARLGCKNMDGGDVDWFAAIKLPPGVDERKGRSFVYFDSSQNGWKLSPVPIESNKSAIGATISQIYKVNKKKTFTIAYNDDSPVKAVESGRGHSKGVAAFNIEVGFWMVHSVPNFPPLDLWYDFIAPNLKTSMAVETWRNGNAQDVGTKCGQKQNVYDVNSVTVVGKTFENSKDHSKWGVSMKKEVPAVCIGDVNRQVSQYKRGGGAVCIEDFKLWKTFYGSISDYEKCKVKPKN